MEFGPGADGNSVPLLFTENSTNFQKLFDVKNTARFVKDAFHDYVVDGKKKLLFVHRDTRGFNRR